MSDDNTILEFETHNAMSRVAMAVGVPLFVLIFHGLAFIVCFFGGIYFFGWWGLVFPPFRCFHSLPRALSARSMTEHFDDSGTACGDAG